MTSIISNEKNETLKLLQAALASTTTASQMGHKDMTMVLKVYGAWMQSGNESEIEKMERALNCRAPSVPHLKINKQ